MWHIATNTLKEFLRMKIIYVIIFFAVLLLFFSLLLAELSINQEVVVVNFSLSVIEIFWLITTLFLASYLIYNEINKKTILLVLSKISSKSDFVIWKFVGFSMLLFIMYVILSFGFWIALLVMNKFIMEVDIRLAYFAAILFSYIKMLVIVAFIIFFSTFVSPFLSLVLSLMIYIISHSTSFMFFYPVYVKKNIPEWSIWYYFLKTVYYVFPNFQDFSLKEYLFSPHLGMYTNFHFLLTVIWWWITYIIILLIFATTLFNKKEF